jgi:hypothetical protein
MRTNLGLKTSRKTPEKQQEPFSLHSTLDQYEVEELDAREIAHLIGERRRRKDGAIPPGSA